MCTKIFVKSTVGAIIDKNSKILLTKRNNEPFRNYWCLPGGHVEYGETAEEAIIREVKEEIGVEFKPKFFMYFDEILPKINWHAIVLVFCGDIRGEVKIGDEVSELGWFSVEEIKKMDLAFIHGRILEEYFKMKGI